MKTKNSKTPQLATPQPATPRPAKTIPAAIKVALLQRGYTVADFARKVRVSRSHMHSVIKRHCGRETRPFGNETYQILLALSRELGFPVHRIISEEDI
jgi:hypothetical protein